MATYRANLLGAHAPECPPEFLTEIEAQEAAGVVYGKGSGSSSSGASETDRT